MSELTDRTRELTAAIGADRHTTWIQSGPTARIETEHHEGQILFAGAAFNYELWAKSDLRTIRRAKGVTAQHAVLHISSYL